MVTQRLGKVPIPWPARRDHPPPPKRRTRPSARSARATLMWALGLVVVTQMSLPVGMITVAPEMRDPEYGRRLNRLRAKVAEHPGKRLVLVLGSSRVAMGFRPEFTQSDDRLVFNMALVGSGPTLEHLALNRLLADGVRPDAVVLEFWPPFWYHEGPYTEIGRIETTRLRHADYPLMRGYTADRDRLDEEIAWARAAPWFTHRFYLVSQVSPIWLPWEKRRDHAWADMDEWGWLPGQADTDDVAILEAKHAKNYAFYGPMLADWRVSPVAREATRNLLELCREHDVPVTLLYMPESGRFGTWYAPRSRERAEAYLESLRGEFGLTVIDCREWMPDQRLLDGFHLTRGGAEQFSRRFAREALPAVRSRGGAP